MSSWKPDIFNYLSFRDFLGDYYTAAKANLPQFSYRYFSRRAGFSSSNFLKLVIDGKRNLGTDSVDKIASAVGLSASEHRFFAHLVAFEQSETPEDRARHLDAITATQRFLEAKPLDGLLFDYLSRWYNVAIRELAARSDFQDDPAWIAAELRPTIREKDAREALEVLLRLGLLERLDDGTLSRGEPTLDAGHEVQAVGVRRFHRQMLERAAEAMDDVPASERDISAMTVCIRADSIGELKQRLRDFREHIMGYCDSQEDTDVVYQINLQLFPLSRSREVDA